MAARPDWPIIQFGSKQKYVYALQCLLRYHGESLSIDDSFGSGTRTALRNFQRSHSLTVDGTAGPDTLMELIVTVQRGDTGDAVLAAQYLMTQFEGTMCDGNFSSRFESSVEDYQGRMRLSVDGIVGRDTWRYLFGYTGYNRQVYVSNTTLTQAEMKVNAQYILDYLRDCGWTKNAVCGMLGNLEVESYINPGYWENGVVNTRRGFGLVQWTPSTKFTDWAEDENLPTDDMDSQLERILVEVEDNLDDQWIPVSSYDFSFYTFTQSKETPYYLACAFLRNYERPDDISSQEGIRGDNAEYWYDLLD